MKTHLDERLPSTLVELLSVRAASLPERRAISFLHDNDEQHSALSYAELDAAARAVACMLTATTQAGDRAVLLYPPGIDFVVGFFGSLYAGLVAVPAFPPDPQRLAPSLARLATVVADAKPAVVLTTTAIADKAQALARAAPILSEVRWLSTEVPQPAPASWQGPRVAPEQLALLQYTSGSTASPKGVMTTHRNVMANLYQLYRSFPPRAESQALLWVPMFHNFGLVAGVLQPMFGGFPAAFMSPLAFLERPRRWLEAVTRLRATTTGGPDFGYELCARAIPADARRGLDLSSLDVAGSGGEPVRGSTLERFAVAFGECGFRATAFKPCYGLSEATLLASANAEPTLPTLLALNPADLKANRVTLTSATDAVTLVSNGRTLDGQTVAIVDPNTHLPVGADQVGEIWLSGPNIAAGYWGKPRETERTFKARRADRPDGQYLRTGDLGFLRDRQLYITGRIKDLIIIRGQNHYPQDIEHDVERSHPLLRPFSAAAFSIEVGGEEKLAIAVEVGPLPTHSFDFDPLARAIRERIATQHGLEAHAISFLAPGALPKTPSAKVMRSACRKAFLAQELTPLFESRLQLSTKGPTSALAPVDLSGLAPSERRARLTALLVDELAHLTKQEAASLNPTLAVQSLGLDSLSVVELRSRIEALCGCRVPLSVMLESPSLEALGEWLNATLTRQASGESDRSIFTQQTPVDTLRSDAHFELPRDWKACKRPDSSTLDVVLLTGATGFTGAYLLRELLDSTRAEIRCLVRASNARDAHAKLALNLSRYGLAVEEPQLARVVPLLGDLSLPAFGMHPAAFHALAEEASAVIHAGAWVNFLYPYSALKASNVDGTRTVLELATTGPLKPVHFLSTLGILMTSDQPDSTPGDAELLESRGSLPNGYEQSKWVADQLCARARRLGLPVYTYRLGLVTGESTTGAYHKLDEFFPCMLKGCLQLGTAPLLEGSSILVPVDYVSRAIVHVLQRPHVAPQTLVLNHPDPLPLERLDDSLRDRGYELRSLPFEAWRQQLFNLPASVLRQNALYPFLDYLRDLNPSQLSIRQLQSVNASSALSDVACRELPPLVADYFDHFERVGFLSRPEQ